MSQEKMKTALIQYARARPLIWDRNVSCSKREREEAWVTFANGFSITVPEAKKRWEGMKRMYCHELKKYLSNNENSTWQFFPLLDSFLRKPVQAQFKKEKEIREFGGKGMQKVTPVNERIYKGSSTSTESKKSKSSNKPPDALTNIKVSMISSTVSCTSMVPHLPDSREKAQLVVVKSENDEQPESSVTISRGPAIKRKLSDSNSWAAVDQPCSLSTKRLSTSSPSTSQQMLINDKANESVSRPEHLASTVASVAQSMPLQKFSVLIDEGKNLFSEVKVERISNTSDATEQKPTTSKLMKSTETEAKDEKEGQFEIKILQTTSLTSIESQLMMWRSELDSVKSESAQIGSAGTPEIDPNNVKEARKYFLLSFLPDMQQMSQEQRRFFKAKLMTLVCSILDSSTP